ncbi:uncharacterized protein LOC110050478 [Orbicella faveolata]|uniref:uncharacterized protein LOC110050478 n=1 Tax=Orbicella faveolata TaxID=48498 RepID=UPI0009E62AFE|nr:uncharacterized protein LOC110050478 [Orbicella faveolata]
MLKILTFTARFAFRKMSNRGAYYKNLYGGGRRGGRGGGRGGYQQRNNYRGGRPDSASYHRDYEGSRTSEDLAYILADLEGKSYKAYHDILGNVAFRHANETWFERPS